MRVWKDLLLQVYLNCVFKDKWEFIRKKIQGKVEDIITDRGRELGGDCQE